MGADLASLEPVIRFSKRVILYFDPIDDPAPIKRVWCLFEILTVADTPGGELTLGLTKEGKSQMFTAANAFSTTSDYLEASMPSFSEAK